MPDTPYPLTATNIEDLKLQLWNLIRPLYEDSAFSKVEFGGSKVTPSVAEINILDGVTATAAKINATCNNPQTHVADAKVDYEAGDLDTEAEVIEAINATNTILNSILATLEACGLHAES